VNLAFLLPAALAALATALLPLLIHLARRSEQRPTLFAALQWLRQKPKPRHRIRFDEWVLLALRVALVCLFALLLARPVLFGALSDAPYVAVAPGRGYRQGAASGRGEGGAVALVGAWVSGLLGSARCVRCAGHELAARVGCGVAGGCCADRRRAGTARWRGCTGAQVEPARCVARGAGRARKRRRTAA
jgi:hypothetical protein